MIEKPDPALRAPPPSPYHKDIQSDKDGYSDVYDVLRAFNVTDPAVAHAIKKMLAPGQRVGGKTVKKDLEEARWSLDNAIRNTAP